MEVRMTTETTTELVPISRSQKLVLKEKPLKEVAETLAVIPLAEAAESFPPVPEPLEATKEVRDALKTLSQLFNKVTIEDRRTMTEEELALAGPELEAIQKVKKLLDLREGALKEYARIHQDVEAEEAGIAFPKDVYHNGNLVAHATPRDAHGHYLLAVKGESRDTPIPGTTLRFANQFVSGKVTESLSAIVEAYDKGEISEAVWKQMTEVRRVPTVEKVKAYVLKTGETWPLAKIYKRGRDSASMYLRAIKRK
jgi:hypothetical protein